MTTCKIIELLSIVPIPALLFLSVQCFLHSVFSKGRRVAIKFFLAGLCMILYILVMVYIYFQCCIY